MSDGEHIYQITFTDRSPVRVVVPDNWKVTFGAAVPGKPGSATSGPMAVRLWETPEKQRAVFLNVSEFIDTSIKVEIAAVRKFGTEEWYEADSQTWDSPKAQKGWKAREDLVTGEPPWRNEVVDQPENAPTYGRRGKW